MQQAAQKSTSPSMPYDSNCHGPANAGSYLCTYLLRETVYGVCVLI